MACLWVYMRNMDYAWKARYAVRPSDLAPVETRNGEEHDAENTSEDDGLLGEDEAIERSTFKHVARTKEQMQDRLEKIDDDSPEHDALVMATASAMERAGSRCIGLYVTLLIEMFVALAVVENSDVLEKYPLLIAFMPVVSAIAGNTGLQSSNINTRALAVGIWSPRQMSTAIVHELKAGAICGLVMGTTLAAIAGVWRAKESGHAVAGLGFGIVVGLSQFLSVISSVVTGAAAPLLFKLLGRDPTTLAGPMETSIQDTLGYASFVILATYLLPLMPS